MKAIFAAVLCAAAVVSQIGPASAQYYGPPGGYYYYGSPAGNCCALVPMNSRLGLTHAVSPGAMSNLILLCEWLMVRSPASRAITDLFAAGVGASVRRHTVAGDYNKGRPARHQPAISRIQSTTKRPTRGSGLLALAWESCGACSCVARPSPALSCRQHHSTDHRNFWDRLGTTRRLPVRRSSDRHWHCRYAVHTSSPRQDAGGRS